MVRAREGLPPVSCRSDSRREAARCPLRSASGFPAGDQGGRGLQRRGVNRGDGVVQSAHRAVATGEVSERPPGSRRALCRQVSRGGSGVVRAGGAAVWGGGGGLGTGELEGGGEEGGK